MFNDVSLLIHYHIRLSLVKMTLVDLRITHNWHSKKGISAKICAKNEKREIVRESLNFSLFHKMSETIPVVIYNVLKCYLVSFLYLSNVLI